MATEQVGAAPSEPADVVRKQDLEDRVPPIRYPAVTATAARPSTVQEGDFFLRRPPAT